MNIKKYIFGILIPLSLPSIATSNELLGLYPADSVELTKNLPNQHTSKQVLWYFKDQIIAVPKSAAYVTQITQKPAMQDLANLNADTLPPLIWVVANNLIPHATLTTNETYIQGDRTDDTKADEDRSASFSIANKIPTNQSFWNDSTYTFFKKRPVRLSGNDTNRGFIVSTAWPLDFKLDLNAKTKPIGNNEQLKSLVQEKNGGAKSAFESRLIWGNASQAHGKAVLGVMLNGAQGDDDEAHGGHFAIATGRVGTDGDMSQWLVNNYYNLASNSEKGIIAAPTPLDKYMADVNSGQSYYRPSVMLVAVFKQDRVPAQFQAATNRVYQHFYRNDFVYDHSRNNCAGISIDTLRNLGWNIPERGVESHLKAIGAYFLISAKERSLTKGRAIYDYLNTEKTRLYPAQTFDATGEDLLNRLLNPASKTLQNGALEKQIKEDIEAIYFVRIPQIPSSRAFGRAPVYGFDEYMSRVPADPKDWKTAPATPNPFPEALKDGLALKLEKPSLVPLPVAIVFTLLLYGLVALFRKIWHLKTVKYSNNIK